MSPKEKILEELRLSRAAITRDAAAVADEINLASKLKKSVRARPLAWLGGAAVIGWLLAGPKTRVVTKNAKGKKVEALPEKSRPSGFWGLLLALFKIALPLARPALSAYAARRLGEMAEKISR
jgi:hypothetical protein